MTRTANTSFGGMAPQDADIDAPTFRTQVLELVQDLNFIADALTGLNAVSAGSVISHNGNGGQGAPLRRVPWVQPVMAPLRNAGEAARVSLFMDSADVATYGGPTYVACVPFLVADGEDLFQLEVEAKYQEHSFTAEVYDSTFAEYNVQPMQESGDSGRHVCSLQFPAAGQYYVLIRHNLIDEHGGPMYGFQCYPPQVRGGSQPTPVDDGANPFGVGDAVNEGWEHIHDEMIQDDYAGASWVLSTLNRNINWLLEYLRGAPPIGNGTLTLADSSSTSPTTSAFFAHARARVQIPDDGGGTTYTDISATEPEVQYLLLTEAFGAVLADEALAGSGVTEVVDSAMTSGLLEWAPIIPTYGGTTRRTAHVRRCYVPDFQSASSRLKARALMVNSNGKGTPTAWDFRVTTGAGSSAAVAFSRLGTSYFYTAEVTAVPFSSDQVNTFELELARSAGVTQHGEIMLVGWQLYFDP